MKKKQPPKNNYLIVIAIFLFLLSVFYGYQLYYPTLPSISFDKSMDAGLKINYGTHATPEEEKRWMEDLKYLYNHNCFNPNYLNKEYKIPPIIHHIWLGSPIPEVYKQLRQTWVAKHPGWIFRLWTDADIENFNLENKELYKLARNYGEKSDILRYELLKRYGGTYLDTDFMCIKSLEPIHKFNDFYAGIMNAGEVLIAIGVLGSIPNHEIVKAVMSSIGQSGSKYDVINIMERTGPIHFTKIFAEQVPNIYNSVVAYPVTYFYPVPNTIRGQACFDQAKNFIKPETFGVHLWECSWMKPQAFLNQNQEDNYVLSNTDYYGRMYVDKFVDEYFNKKHLGTFVDIGSEDGINFNNTCFLEKSRNWKGICIEPEVNVFGHLVNNRDSFCANIAIINSVDNNSLQNPYRYTYKLKDLLKLCRFEKIDYLSVSSYNAEFILRAVDFKNCDIHLISINSGQDAAEKILFKNSYKLLKDLDGIRIFEKALQPLN